MNYGVLEREQPPRLRDCEEKPNPFGKSRNLWLLLLREGGFWSAAEVAELTGLKSDRAGTLLDGMHRSRELVRRDKTGDSRSRVRFGVSDSCEVPRGVSIREVIELAKVKDE